MNNKRVFSLYDIEQFLKDAGAERVKEKAVVSLAQELEDTVKELVDDAQVYANYAGRTKLIKSSDIELASEKKLKRMPVTVNKAAKKKVVLKMHRRNNLNNMVANYMVQTQNL